MIEIFVEVTAIRYSATLCWTLYSFLTCFDNTIITFIYTYVVFFLAQGLHHSTRLHVLYKYLKGEIVSLANREVSQLFRVCGSAVILGGKLVREKGTCKASSRIMSLAVHYSRRQRDTEVAEEGADALWRREFKSERGR